MGALKADDGGPAYPVTFQHMQDEHPLLTSVEQRWEGMTLRQWYAGMAMQGFLGHPTWWVDGEGEDIAPLADPGSECEAVAQFAFKMADAMLAREREAPTASPEPPLDVTRPRSSPDRTSR